MREKEYPPLYSRGFKDLQERDLYNEFVTPVREGTEHRNNLLIDFGRFLNEFKALGITAEVWIDGSFATYAPDPADVDVVFFLKQAEIDSLTEDLRPKFEKLFLSRKFIRNLYKTEVHYAHMNDVWQQMLWQKTFGTCYDNVTPKGIFRIYFN